MEKLITIQKREKLNDIYAVDKKGNGGANHKYELTYSDKSAIDEENGLLLVAPSDFVATIQFQNGAKKLDNSTHGIIDSDLLEIVRHRLQSFQNGEFATRENAIALTHIEEALMWMNRRVEDRIERNVLGTNNK